MKSLVALATFQVLRSHLLHQMVMTWHRQMTFGDVHWPAASWTLHPHPVGQVCVLSPASRGVILQEATTGSWGPRL